MRADFDNEAVLVENVQKGDTESFITLVQHYEKRIYRLGYAVTNDANVAEEVLQETFMKAFENFGQFKGESRFYVWLVQIAANEALARLRQHPTRLGDSLDMPAGSDEPLPTPRDFGDWRENPEEGFTRGELTGILSKALLHLEARLRLVFVLRDMEDLSLEETARVLRISVAAAESRLLHARLKLREALTTWFKDSSVLTDRAEGERAHSDFSVQP